MDLTARLDAMEAAIKKPSFRQSSGKANEVNYWIFDYPPEKAESSAVSGAAGIVKAVSNSMKVSENDSLVVQYIQEHTPENAIVFLTGVGKCYPLLRSHNVLNNLHQSYLRAPVVMFFPGTYNEQELILFNEIKDDNYYRAFRLVK